MVSSNLSHTQSFGSGSNIDTSLSSDTASRLFLHNKEAFAKRLKLQQQIREEEIKENRDPFINPQSKKLKRKLTSVFLWDEEKKNHLQELIRKHQIETLAEVLGHPKINSKSQELVATRSCSNLRVEDRLLSAGNMLKAKKENRRKEHLLTQKLTSPTISINRVGDIHERLFRDRKANKDYFSPHLEHSFISPRVVKTPTLNDVRNSRDSLYSYVEPIHERLIRCGTESKLRKEELQRELNELENRQRNVTQYIGPYSTLLNQLVERRTNTPVWERATSPTNVSMRRQCGEAAQDDPNATFHPYVSELSRAIDVQKHGCSLTPKQRIETLYLKQNEANSRLLRLQAQKTQEDICELRDSPVTKRRLENGNVTQPPLLINMDFHQKNLLWKKRIEIRRLREQRQKEFEKLAECTFHPNIAQNLQTEFSLLSSGYRSVTPPPRWTSGSNNSNTRKSTRSCTPPSRNLSSSPQLKRENFTSLELNDILKRAKSQFASLPKARVGSQSSSSFEDKNAISYEDDLALLFSHMLSAYTENAAFRERTRDLIDFDSTRYAYNPSANRSLENVREDPEPREWKLPENDLLLEGDEVENQTDGYHKSKNPHFHESNSISSRQQIPTIGDVVSQAISMSKLRPEVNVTPSSLSQSQKVPFDSFSSTSSIVAQKDHYSHCELYNCETFSNDKLVQSKSVLSSRSKYQEDLEVEDYDDEYARQREELLRKIEETKKQLAKEQEGLQSLAFEECAKERNDYSPSTFGKNMEMEQNYEEEKETPEFYSFLKAQEETRMLHLQEHDLFI